MQARRSALRAGQFPFAATLVEIYAELNSLWRLPQKAIDQMMACELETERENLFAISGALPMVRAARLAGWLGQGAVCAITARQGCLSLPAGWLSLESRIVTTSALASPDGLPWGHIYSLMLRRGCIQVTCTLRLIFAIIKTCATVYPIRSSHLCWGLGRAAGRLEVKCQNEHENERPQQRRERLARK